MHVAAPHFAMHVGHAKTSRQGTVNTPLPLESTVCSMMMKSLRLQTVPPSHRRLPVRVYAMSAEEDDDSDWEDEDDDLDVNEFDDVTITTDTQDPNTIVWADYLSTSVEGSTMAEIEEEDQLAGVETKASAIAASYGAAAAAALAAGETAENVAVAGGGEQGKQVDVVPVVDPAVVAASASKFFKKDRLSVYPDHGPLSEWDLRAAMEKRRRMERERDEWLANKEKNVGCFRAVASDWRTDVRILDTGDPTQPTYREWTIKEIWDLITLQGGSVDPRTLPYRIESPNARTDFVAEGFYQHPEVPEYLAMQGRLIDEDDEADVLDPDAEALLASEFSDFEDFAGSADQSLDAVVDDNFSADF